MNKMWKSEENPLHNLISSDLNEIEKAKCGFDIFFKRKVICLKKPKV